VLNYAARHTDVLTLFWTESTAFDSQRHWLQEKIKSRLVRQFDGALAAGAVHAEYMVSLGMAQERVAVVGGCVDNQFFAFRAVRPAAAQPYFLYVGRFVPQKNLPMLLEAYRRYRKTCKDAWELVLVGAGPEEVRLRGIEGVRLDGLKQVNELPASYAGAGCFVLPSLSEPWGLVVNEAMASGLPVLVSRRCGCATDLVREGENGFLFDPARPEELARLMEMVATGAVNRAALGAASRQIVSGFTVERFAARAVAHMVDLHERRSGVRVEALTEVD
jgi:glycosyltransferase involved in cell wall biosynthesis